MPAYDVKFPLLYEWWTAILGLDSMLLNQHASDLEGLDGIAGEFGLPALPEISFIALPKPDFISDKPAFKYLDLDAIKYLRHCIIDRSDPTSLEAWAESMLRFMEINFSQLSDRVGGQFSSLKKREAMLWLAAFIMDFYEYSRDLRYLNLALKLMDFPGIISVTRISTELTGNRIVEDTTFLSVRLILMQKAALNRLGSGSGK